MSEHIGYIRANFARYPNISGNTNFAQYKNTYRATEIIHYYTPPTTTVSRRQSRIRDGGLYTSPEYIALQRAHSQIYERG